MKRLKLFFVLLVAAGSFFSCSEEDLISNLVDITINSGVRSYEICIPPMPANPDTLFASIALNIDIDSLLSAQGVSANIESIKLEMLDLTMLTTGANFDAVTDERAVLVSTTLPNVTIASINNVPNGLTKLELVENDSELVDYFQSGSNTSLELYCGTSDAINDSLKMRVDLDLKIVATP